MKTHFNRMRSSLLALAVLAVASFMTPAIASPADTSPQLTQTVIKQAINDVATPAAVQTAKTEQLVKTSADTKLTGQDSQVLDVNSSTSATSAPTERPLTAAERRARRDLRFSMHRESTALFVCVNPDAGDKICKRE